MVEIGDRPILWHIMKHYSHFGFSDFVVALGYKGEFIKRYFADYHALEGNLRVDLAAGRIQTEEGSNGEKWLVELVETGKWTNTGGRIKRLAPYLGDETFMLTHGDGVSDLPIPNLLDFHRAHGKIATVTAVHPPARFGRLDLEGDVVKQFSEKPLHTGWINGAYFVLEPEVFDYIEDDHTQFEFEPLTRLAEDGELMAYRHEGFWQCMDTVRDKALLQRMWDSPQPQWRLWD